MDNGQCWNKLNRFKIHEGKVYCVTTTQPICFPTLGGVSVEPLEPLNLETPIVPRLKCDHEWTTEERSTRAADEMVTIITYCVKCNYSLMNL